MADLEVTCPCGKNFKRKATYERHMEVAHSETVSHKCKICGKTFGNSNTLTMHMSVHEPKQNFAKLVRTRKATKTAATTQLDKSEENKSSSALLEKSTEGEDSSSEKENSECQTSPPGKSLLTSSSSSDCTGSNKHDTEQNVLSEKTTVNSAKNSDVAPSKVVVVKATPLPSLKEIIDSQTTTSTITLPKESFSAPFDNVNLPKPSCKPKDSTVSSVSETTQQVSLSSTSKVPVTVNLLQSSTSQVKGGDNSPVINGSNMEVPKVSSPPVSCPELMTCNSVPVARRGVVASLRGSRVSSAEVTTAPPLPLVAAGNTTVSSSAAAASNNTIIATLPSTVTSSHPATAAILSAPPAAASYPPPPPPPSCPAPPLPTESLSEVATAVNALVSEHTMDAIDDTDDKLREEDLNFITDEDLVALEDDDVDDMIGINGEQKEGRKSKRKRSENPIWKSLLTGKVYEEILKNLEGTPTKKARKDINVQETNSFLHSEDLTDLPVKVEVIPQLDCIKTEPFDPDFPDLDQLEAATSLESPTSSSDQTAPSSPTSPKIEFDSTQVSDMSKRYVVHPGMSDKRSKSQNFDCFVCGKSFNSEKYLTMHISLHGTVKNADDLLAPEPESPPSVTVPSPLAVQPAEVNPPIAMEYPSEPAVPPKILTPHQQLSQQVAALQQQSRQLQQQSALLQQQLQQQHKSKSNVKKSPPAVNRVVSEGGGWSCTLCHKSFAHNSGYKNHMRTHSNERPYVCSICDIGFKEKYHLKKHNLFIHSSELPEKCRFCGKRFKDSTAVRAHERIHSDERPFACRRCTKTFKTSECLWHHEHRSKTCGQALGDIIAREKAQRKRRKFPKTELDDNKNETKLRIKQEPGSVVLDSQNCINMNSNTSSAAAICAANAAIERNVQAIMMAEQRKAKENQVQDNSSLMKIPEVVIKKEMEDVPPSPTCDLQQQQQPLHVPLANGLFVSKHEQNNFLPPPVSSNKSHPNQTVISMLSQPPRPAQPPPPPPQSPATNGGKTFTQIPTGRPIMSTMAKPVQHVQPQQQQQQIQGTIQQRHNLQQSMTPQQLQQAARPLQQHPSQVVLPQQQKQQPSEPAQITRPPPPQAVVQPQPRQPQNGNFADPQQEQTGDNKDFTCKLCNKSFKDVSSFQRHCKIHTEERPFICEMCDIGFKMKVHLKKHNLYVHSDEYPCECQHCGKRFKDSSAVKLHERTHSDSRPFQCDGCHKAFKTRENLWGHQHRGKCMASKSKGPFVGGFVGSQKEGASGGKTPMSAQASVNDHKVAAHASLANDQVTAQAYVSTSQITAQAIIQNNQVTAHAMFNNSRVTAHASIVNNQLHAQAYVSDPSDPTGGKSVNVKLEKPAQKGSCAAQPDEQLQEQCEKEEENTSSTTKVSKSTSPSIPTVDAIDSKNALHSELKDSCYPLEDQQALDASVLTSQMRAAISSTPVANIDDESSPLSSDVSLGAISRSSSTLSPVSVPIKVPSAAPSVAIATDASPTGTPSQTSPSAKWPTLKEFLAVGINTSPVPEVPEQNNWFNRADQAKSQNVTKVTTANDYPTIKERLMGTFFANTAAGVVDTPRQQTTVGMVVRPHQPPPGIPRVTPGPPPPPYPGTNKLSPPPPYTSAQSPSAISVTSSPTAMEIASIMSTSPGGSGGSIPSFQSTFLSKRTPPLPPISSLGSSPVMMRGEDPSIPVLYWDEDSSEKESQVSHWHGSGSSESSTDSMFHDMSLAEKMLTQL